MTDHSGYGGVPQETQEVDLVDLHEVEVLDEVRSVSDRDVDEVPDEVIDLDDEHVQEDDEDDEDDKGYVEDGAYADSSGAAATAAATAADAATAAATAADVMVLDSWQIQLAATGDEQVDAALARLTEVEGLPPSGHAEIYEAVHVGLTGALADLDRS